MSLKSRGRAITTVGTMWSDVDPCNDSGVLPVNDDNFVGKWTNTTMNLSKTPKRIRNSTEDEEVNIESETSEGSDFTAPTETKQKGPSG